jgi:hypothetical protein
MLGGAPLSVDSLDEVIDSVCGLPRMNDIFSDAKEGVVTLIDDGELRLS